MDKAKTLPRTQRDASPTPSSSSFASLRSATSEKIKKMPLIRKKKKKKGANSLEVPENNISRSESRTDVSDVDSQEVSQSSYSQSPAASPSLLRPPVNGVSSSPKSPRSAKKTKDTLKSIIKGGKNLMTFKGKNESAPIMVEPVLDLRRSNKKEGEESPVPERAPVHSSNENLAMSDGESEEPEPQPQKTPAEEDYDWSVKSTCARVKKLSIAELRESVYEDEIEQEDLTRSNVSTMPPTPEVWEETEEGKTAFNLSSSSPPHSPEALSDTSDQSSVKKSPTTLKKEILHITRQRKVSDHVVNGTVLRSRKISLQARTPSDKNELLFKILVIGELGTGKTSIIKRYVHQFFSQHYRATIGVDFALKVLSWDNDTTIRLQLWDIAGQERFGNMTRVYYKEAVGAFIVFDVTRLGTFEAVTKWKQDLDSKVQLPDGGAIPCVLLANKCDQPKEGVVNNPSKMDEFCKVNDFIAWYETSAKDNINIDDAANCLVTKIIQNDQKRQQEKETANGTSTGTISVSPDHHENAPKKSCAC